MRESVNSRCCLVFMFLAKVSPAQSFYVFIFLCFYVFGKGVAGPECEAGELYQTAGEARHIQGMVMMMMMMKVVVMMVVVKMMKTQTFFTRSNVGSIAYIQAL